jgi:hypothetical protein
VVYFGQYPDEPNRTKTLQEGCCRRFPDPGLLRHHRRRDRGAGGRRTTDFSVLQNQLRGKSDKIVMVAFDLLYLNGYDLRKLPLDDARCI